MATTEREHLEEMRHIILELVSAHLSESHVSTTHANEWIRYRSTYLAERAHGRYSHSDDIPSCPKCRAYAASIELTDALMDDLGEDARVRES